MQTAINKKEKSTIPSVWVRAFSGNSEWPDMVTFKINKNKYLIMIHSFILAG